MYKTVMDNIEIIPKDQSIYMNKMNCAKINTSSYAYDKNNEFELLSYDPIIGSPQDAQHNRRVLMTDK